MNLLSRRNTVKAPAPTHKTNATRIFPPAPWLLGALGASKSPRPPECWAALNISSAAIKHKPTFTPATIQMVEFKRPFISPPRPFSVAAIRPLGRLLRINSSLLSGIWYLVLSIWWCCQIPTTKYQRPPRLLTAFPSNQPHGERFRQLLQIQRQRQPVLVAQHAAAMGNVTRGFFHQQRVGGGKSAD